MNIHVDRKIMWAAILWGSVLVVLVEVLSIALIQISFHRAFSLAVSGNETADVGFMAYLAVILPLLIVIAATYAAWASRGSARWLSTAIGLFSLVALGNGALVVILAAHGGGAGFLGAASVGTVASLAAVALLCRRHSGEIVRPAGVGVALGVAAAAVIVVAIPAALRTVECGGFELTRDRWYAHRHSTAERIVDCGSLDGRDRAGVAALLGRPSSMDSTEFMYSLPVRKGAFMLAPDIPELIVTFDRRGSVVGARLATD